jgi:Amt family ammonium transporter
VLWFGFIPFNAGSGVTMIGWMAGQTGRVAVMTTMGGCSGGMVGLFYGYIVTGKMCGGESKSVLGHASLEHVICGILAGMVSVCSPCAVVNIAAVFWCISPVGVLSYFFFMWVNTKCKVDDPLGASALHFGPGAVGMIAVGFFATPELVNTYYACSYGSVRIGDNAALPCECYHGLFFGGNGQQMGIQLMALAIYTIYGFITCGILFYGMKACKILRVSEEDELAGLDITHHGGPCYIFEDEPPPAATKTAEA